MSSSTSSSRPFRTELAVIAWVVAMLLVCEFGVRALNSRMSFDMAHIRQIPSIVERLKAAGPVRILFLGNSLTHSNVDREVLRNELQPTMSDPLTMESIYPDDTTIGDWHYLYRTTVANRHVVPEVVVVGFALRQLEDSTPLHMGRLGGYFAGWAGMREAFEHDIPATGDRITYILSTTSSLMSDQERVRERVLDLAVPSYRTTAQELNRAVRHQSQAHEPETAPSFGRLRRFIRMVEDTGAALVFVAMPLPGEYPLAPELEAVIESEGAVLLDAQRSATLPDDAYADGYHLSPSGARVFSAALAERLKTEALVAPALRSHSSD